MHLGACRFEFGDSTFDRSVDVLVVDGELERLALNLLLDGVERGHDGVAFDVSE